MRRPALLAIFAASVLPIAASNVDSSLAREFASPPPETRPWTFWYWMNNHVSREGITRDLEAMKKFGIGTVIIGNVYMSDLPSGNVPMFSKEWEDLTVFAIREGHRIGIDFGIFNCPGWSQSGGPWISADQTMRFLNWSETKVSGGSRFHGSLPLPRPDFKDVAVLAFPSTAEEERTLRNAAPRITAPHAADDLQKLVDGNLGTIVRFPADRSEWKIEWETTAPITARSLTIHPSKANFTLRAELRALPPGRAPQSVRTFSIDRSNNRLAVGPVPFAPVTVDLPETTSSKWELVLTEISTRDPNAMWIPPQQTPDTAGFAEIELSAAPRLDLVVEKQLGKVHPTPTPRWDSYQFPDRPGRGTDRNLATPPQQVIDLSGSFNADGTLTWDAPPGNWTVMRFGMSPTGITNHPAAPNATGFEVDKMNRELAIHHFDAFVGKVLSRLGQQERKAVKFVAVDSYEVGSQNWTDDNRASFEKSFGYDPLPWLLALTGRVVGSPTESNRFLWDLRRHIADRISYDYAGGLAEAARKAGLELWLQNYGHWGFPGEFMQYGGQADMLSGEFWAAKTLGEIECRAAASASHAYGKPVVYGEAFTSLGFFESHPYSLKARGDWAYTIGVNHLVIQVTMHQPSEKKPGANAWFGTEFNRHNTWYAQGRAWSDYMSRCNFLLRQGRHVADVAYFIGEDTPAMTGPTEPRLPAGYAFDFVNAEVIQERMQVKDGRFVLPDGTCYRLLVLPALRTMRPALLARIAQLVKDGGAILGDAPESSPSLAGFPESDNRVAQLARELWNGTGKYGRGRVIGGADLAAALRTVGVGPAIRGLEPEKTLWIHRATPESEIYFVSNQTDENVVLAPTFRATGAPELWDAVTGTIISTARHRTVEGGTQVTLPLGPSGSVFVVFPAKTAASTSVAAVMRDGNADETTVVERDAQGLVARIAANGRYQFTTGTGAVAQLEVQDIPKPLAPASSWQLKFPPGMDAPTQLEMPRLISWTEHTDEAVRHFSGTGAYHNDFDVPAPWLKSGRRVFLDLGKVEVIADIHINGKRIGTAWLPPYRLDVTDALKPGKNRVEVETTNLWRNRIIGDMRFPDAFPGAGQRKQFKTELFTYGGWDKKPVLFPSGLLGPVTLQVVQDHRVRP